MNYCVDSLLDENRECLGDFLENRWQARTHPLIYFRAARVVMRNQKNQLTFQIGECKQKLLHYHFFARPEKCRSHMINVVPRWKIRDIDVYGKTAVLWL